MLGVQLRGHVQHYAWGKPMSSSLVAELSRATDDSKPYAELWMGAHPKGMSTLKDSGESLASFVEEKASWLGDAKQLPFLLKILSVNHALSIQAHPAKSLAEQLAKTNPEMYDSNHKPEIALPLGPFEALCAFRPMAEIRQFLESTPELRDLCGDGPELEKLYGQLMRADETLVKDKANSLVERLKAKHGEHTKEEKLVLRLYKDYPGDVGIFSVFFLNYVVIDTPHQFIFCTPNIPHAYLSGECIECMALSDNVVRAGLTPKFKDVDLLLSMLSYQDDLLHQLVNTGAEIASGVFLYNPPVDDFKVYEVTRPFALTLPHASIAICLKATQILPSP
eukprot:GEMP01042721.1.p1 GENE.GEMP01042721.1~~GEMP01042721.1.p1  ORF type:complete len:336 (+),score=56.43 GEMP01042721.1:225-1232(+)